VYICELWFSVNLYFNYNVYTLFTLYTCTHSNLPPSYIGSCSSAVSPEANEMRDDKDTLRRSVEDLFNHHYGLHNLYIYYIAIIHICSNFASRTVCRRFVCKVALQKIENYGIIMNGLPSRKQLKHPSSYGSLLWKKY